MGRTLQPGWNGSPMERFLRFCRFEPDTGCVVWTGGTTQGRGHYQPYGAFWFDRRRWFAHRWAAKHIHGLEIDGFHVDHCCPHIPLPNTLCVEHVQALTNIENIILRDERRKFIHLQVGLVTYEDIYGPDVEPENLIPFFEPPAWLINAQGATNDNAIACPF